MIFDRNINKSIFFGKKNLSFRNQMSLQIFEIKSLVNDKEIIQLEKKYIFETYCYSFYCKMSCIYQYLRRNLLLSNVIKGRK